MLKLLRKKKVSKRIFYILAAIIIPAFVVWGSASVLNKNKTPDYAGIIFGKKVSFDDFKDALYAWKTQLKLQYGEKAEEIASAFFEPTQAAWDRLILLHEVRQRKIRIKDADIVNALTDMPFLQRDGRFDPQTYDLFLRYSLGIPPRAFEEQLRQNLALAKVFQQVTAGVTITDDEIRKEYERQNVQTRVKYVFFPSQGYKDKVSIPEEEVKSYYEGSKEKFRVPPQINAQYLGLEFKEGSTEEEKAGLREKIKNALSTARNKGLTEAAKEAGLEVKETGLFGFEDPIPTFGWMRELSQLLFDLEAQTFSKPVELSRGVYLFRIKEKKDAYIPEFKDTKEKVKDTLLKERSKEIAKQKAREFLNAIKQRSLSFEKVAEAEGLAIKETPLFSSEGYIPELGMAQELKDAAFKLAKDAVADNPIELEQGFYCIKSLETAAFDEEKFKKDKDEFSKQALEQKRNKAFNDFFENLKKQAGLVSLVPKDLKRK